jgi:competence protein ComEC
VAVLTAVAAVVAWPLLQGLEQSGSLELLMLAVGQGDAVALRTPSGRWILVDAGPPGRTSDDGAHPAVRALRRRGVARLEMLVLTHPDLDHIGGAAAVLHSFTVGRVLDPGLPAGKGPFVEVLQAAAQEGVPWTVAVAGQRFDVDGVSLDVLYPRGAPTGAAATANDVSVVLRVRYGAFDALLTGDAPAAVERIIAPAIQPIEVLKVGHHGSDTSTDSLLVLHARPQAALISVGRGNRYGHPSPAVVSRLERAGVALYRTDRQGTLRIRARRDGRFAVEAEGRARR